jgi:hypothetical protein
MQCEMALLDHQLDFVSDITTKYLGLVGGYGCGKTKALCAKTIDIASRNVGYEGALFEPTYPQIKRVLIPEMDRILQAMGIPYEFSKGEMFYILHFAHGSTKIHLLSGENYNRLVGMNLAFFGIDEADVMRREDIDNLWKQCVARMRRGRCRRGFTTSTPEGFEFLYDFFVVNGDDPERRLIHGDTENNPFLPPDYVENLKKQYPAHQIAAYLKGQFVNLNSGSVYPLFDRRVNHTDRTLADFDQNAIIHVGQDFNYGKMASTISIVEKGIVYVIDEISKGLDTYDVVKKLKAKYPNRVIYVYPDATGGVRTSGSDVAIFQKENMKCFYNNANPRVMHRVNAINAMCMNGLGEVRLFVNTRTAPEVAKCLERQVYKDGEPDKSGGFDHMNDALGYFVLWNFNVTGKGTLKVRN